MALEGSLKEFGLADILQLIYFQRKTGVLTIAGRQDNVRLLFNNGNVIFAASKVRDESMRTGRMLVKKGIISAEDLQKALAEQKGVRLGAYLIRSNLASKEQVQEALTVQITETVFQLFSWKEGRYEFKPQGVPVDKDIGLSIDTQHLLMEGLRLLDEWSLIKGKLETDTVVVKTGAGAEGFSPEEAKVLELVDGEADVSTIASYSGMDSIQVSKALLSLLEKKAIAKKEEAAPEPKAPVPFKAAKPKTGAIAALSVIAALVVALLSLFAAKFKTEDFGVSADMEKTRVMIEAKRYETGSYPQSITETDPWGNRYIYELKEGGFTLKSAGPDGVAGNADDVR